MTEHMTGTPSEGKNAIAVNSFADLQRGTVGSPKDGPFPEGQEDLDAQTPAEHQAAKGLEVTERDLAAGETIKQAEKAAKDS